MKKKGIHTSEAFYLDDDVKNGALVIKERKDITLGELANGYVDNSENIEGGVYGWEGKLEIRPKFQRAFVVDGNKGWQTALLHSVLNNRPIGVMYFGMSDDKMYINIDGQQRLMTLLSFINGDLTLKIMKEGKMSSENFEGLPEEWQNRIKNYTPSIKICMGSEEALLEWFATINQPISELTQQELKNAAYNGPFVEHLKRIFARTKKSASLTEDNADVLGEDSIYCYKKYTSGLIPERQDIVEFALDWISGKKFGFDMPKDIRIESYMLEHRYDDNANETFDFYKEVIDWTNDIFFHNYTPKSYQSLASQPWARMYLQYRDITRGFSEEEKKHITERCKFFIGMGAELYQKSDGIYEWVLRGEKKEEENTYLHIRAFKPEDRAKRYRAQGGFDPIDGKHYEIDEMEAHHIIPWEFGGPTDYDNMVMLSKKTHDALSILGLTPDDVKAKRDELCFSIKNA